MNIERLIEDFSGAPEGDSAAMKHRAVAERLAGAGHEITPDGIKKWRERGSIPAEWIVRMLQVSQKSGKPLDLAHYI